MNYKVTKKFFNPLSQKRNWPGDIIEIPEAYLRSFDGYVERTDEQIKAEPVVIPEETQKDLPCMTFIERPKREKKKKSGGDS